MPENRNNQHSTAHQTSSPLQKLFETVERVFKGIDIKNIDGSVYNQLNTYAHDIGKELSLNSSKLRKFYNHIKKLEMEISDHNSIVRKLNKFIAIMMYDVGRENNEELKNFALGMKKLVDLVKSSNEHEIKKFYNIFLDFFESLVAYHRYYHPERS
ncbi:type III-A CRISPR-associated protein Csm2 [Fervidobacterium nodosum]|uniref:CRISPR system Cms protein Csm2 n=1 Tax=Fervidobacterium nodosum (strain ATCC 35602 / DSM 5306 / Rt17-B1) TaxID=381764 RepID=A7HMV2_FERNB|nr:type III-A CRISPR-associated protein Csm2 [Fervidobacterium nodosum]ABS61235.1 CRISPR-associated protein, Csm2 family [Fervidobacterium nodosum Rt17-B1]